MAKGIIYIMTTVVPGLIKIGKTGSNSFESRMYTLEHNGYSNVTALKRSFAIEVEDYDEKETLLHTIFEKSRVSDTELFAVDVNIATQLLASFEGTVIYPQTETKDQLFDEAADSSTGKLIPDGKYTLKRVKKSDNKEVLATAEVKNGRWTILKGSILGIVEDKGVPQKAKAARLNMQVNSQGKLLENYELGEVSPSFAGCIVLNASNDGWHEWKNRSGQAVDVYRQKNKDVD